MPNEPENPPLDALFDRMREALQAAQLQLEYLDSRFPTGTTPPTIAKIERVLVESLISTIPADAMLHARKQEEL